MFFFPVFWVEGRLVGILYVFGFFVFFFLGGRSVGIPFFFRFSVFLLEEGGR